MIPMNASRRGRRTFAASTTKRHCSWCAFSLVMTPPIAAGISTSHGRVSKSSVGIAVPAVPQPRQSFHRPPVTGSCLMNQAVCALQDAVARADS